MKPSGVPGRFTMRSMWSWLLTEDHQRFWFDRLCVYQGHEVLKAETITAIPAFIAQSKGMLVLWDDTRIYLRMQFFLDKRFDFNFGSEWSGDIVEYWDADRRFWDFGRFVNHIGFEKKRWWAHRSTPAKRLFKWPYKYLTGVITNPYKWSFGTLLTTGGLDFHVLWWDRA